MDFFKHKISAYIPELRRYAFALINHKETADDLVQDSLERALVKQHLWHANKPLRPWLFSIMHNIFANDARRFNRVPQHLSVQNVLQHDMPQSQIEEPLSDLQRSLDMLNKEQREILLLIGLEQMSYTETAEVLDIPVGTVMSRIARARKNLRELMKETTIPTSVANIRRVK